MSAVEQTPTEFFGTLTGFDEIGIEKEFGHPVVSLLQTNMSMWVRALIFVDMKRRKTEADPKQAALRLTMTEVGEYFLPEQQADAGDEDAESGDAPGEAPA